MHFVKEKVRLFRSSSISSVFSQSGMVGPLHVRSGGRRFVLFFKLRMVLELWSVHLEVGNVGDIFQDTFFQRGSMESFISRLCNLLGQALVRERKIDLTFNDVSVVC